MLNVKIEQKPKYELMSICDAGIMIIAQLFSNEVTIKILHDQMIIRHKTENEISIGFIQQKQFLKSKSKSNDKIIINVFNS